MYSRESLYVVQTGTGFLKIIRTQLLQTFPHLTHNFDLITIGENIPKMLSSSDSCKKMAFFVYYANPVLITKKRLWKTYEFFLGVVMSHMDVYLSHK